MKGKNDIYVLEVGSKYRVRPAVWSCEGKMNEQVKVRNLTSKTIIVIVPKTLTGTVNDVMTSIASQGQASIGLKSLASGAPAESSGYAVLVQAASGFEPAQGESDPIIIIDP